MKDFKVLIFFILIFLLSIFLPVSGDEAYYLDCSHHLDWSYFDQPPLVIWLVKFFNLFLNSKMSIRIPSIIFTFFVFLLLKKWLKEKGKNLFLIFSTAPLIFFGSFYLSTDRALSFFYLLATYILLKINEENKTFLWFLEGIAFGFGFLSKFPMVLILPLVFYIFYKKGNLFQFFVFSITSFLISLPVFIYAYQNGWANITFQLFERHKEESNFLKVILHLWLPNLILMGPLFFFKGIFEAIKNYKKNLILFFSGAIPIVFFTIAGVKNPGAPHWLSLGLLPLSVLQIDRWKKKEIKISVLINIFITIIFLIILIFPSHFFKFSPSIFKNFIDFNLLKEEVLKEKRDGEILISPSYSIVALLNYHLKGEYEVYLFNINKGIHGLSYLYWQKKLNFNMEKFLFISNKKINEKKLKNYFKEINLKVINIKYKNISSEFYLYHCIGIKDKSPFYPS